MKLLKYYSSAELRRIISIKEQIETLQTELEGFWWRNGQRSGRRADKTRQAADVGLCPTKDRAGAKGTVGQAKGTRRRSGRAERKENEHGRPCAGSGGGKGAMGEVSGHQTTNVAPFSRGC